MSSMFCKKIYQCRNADWCARDFNPKSDEPECFEQMTNYDRLISKTPEELAHFITGEDPCVLLCKNSPSFCNGDCEKRMIEWFKRPAEECE